METLEISSDSSDEPEIIDFEEQITETHVKKPEQGKSTEIRVKTVTRKDQGFSSTKIEKFEIAGAQQNPKPSYSRQPNTFKKPPQICDTISLAIEDLLDAEKFDDHWKVFDTHFRCVLIYGRIIVLNQFTKNDRNYYKFKIDDGTGAIVGIMGVVKDAQRDVEGFKKLLSAKPSSNKISGLSDELLKSIEILNNSTKKEVSKLLTEFRLGPMNEKALVLGNLYMKENEQQPQLNVIDLSPNDEAELYWKRQLNLIYEREYLKDVSN